MKYADKKQILDLFKILNNNIDYFVKEKYEGADELKELVQLCRTYKVKVAFSPTMIRGLSYYTGNIFEAYSKDIKGSLFAGGRYDNLVGRYIGRQIPAVGISFGRILDSDIESEYLKAIIISIKQDKKSTHLLVELRNNKISSFVMDKLNKALEYANSYNVPYVIFIGSDEVKKKKYKLRNMKTGDEFLLSEKEIIEKLRI
jgi:histidyl-tRNA synthetase